MSPRARKEPLVDVDDIDAQLQDHVRAADGLRAAGLERLAGVRAGRAAGLERERARLAEELDEDDPRIVVIDDRLELDRDMVEALGVELERARTEPEPIGDREWAVRGRVLDPDLQAAPDLVVSAHDARGGWIEPFGRACTDERGAFVLRYEFGAAEPPAGPGAEEAFVRVHDSDGKLLAVHDRPLEPHPGRADYVEVVLGAPPRDCPGPPDDRL